MSQSNSSYSNKAEKVHIDDIVLIRKDDKNNYYYGDKALDFDQYLAFIKINCPDAYKTYCTGKK